MLDQAAFVKGVRIKIFGIGNTIKFTYGCWGVLFASGDIGGLDYPFGNEAEYIDHITVSNALSPTAAFRSQNGIRISCCLTTRALLCAFRSGLTFFFVY